MKIVFFGTADFAVPTLEILHQNNYQIVAVVTAPDKPAGRGQKISQSPVKTAAQALGLKVLQPEKLKSQEFQAQLQSLQPDLGVIVAFRMLPQSVWAMPRLGTVNLHGSLLPQYRGAAPIHWAVINGEEKTGVTTFFLQHEIDTGDLIYQEETPIADDDTTGTVYNRLMKTGAELMLKTVKAIEAGQAPKIPQSAGAGTHHAPKLTAENTQIDWQLPAQKIINLVRGLNPFPAAHGELTLPQGSNARYKFYLLKSAARPHKPITNTPGTLVIEGKQALITCGPVGEEVVEVVELQPEGKRRMAATDWLNGLRN